MLYYHRRFRRLRHLCRIRRLGCHRGRQRPKLSIISILFLFSNSFSIFLRINDVIAHSPSSRPRKLWMLFVFTDAQSSVAYLIFFLSRRRSILSSFVSFFSVVVIVGRSIFFCMLIWLPVDFIAKWKWNERNETWIEIPLATLSRFPPQRNHRFYELWVYDPTAPANILNLFFCPLPAIWLVYKKI